MDKEKIFYMDDKENIVPKEKATRARIVGTKNGKLFETWAALNQKQQGPASVSKIRTEGSQRANGVHKKNSRPICH